MASTRRNASYTAISRSIETWRRAVPKNAQSHCRPCAAGRPAAGYSGPLDVFAQANLEAGREYCYAAGDRLRAGPDPQLFRRPHPAGQGGGERPTQRFDTLLVAGAPHAHRSAVACASAQWLRRERAAITALRLGLHRRLRPGRGRLRLTAAASPPLGSRVETLTRAYPAVTVDEDAFTCATASCAPPPSVTAGLDLALALVEEDLGRRSRGAWPASWSHVLQAAGGQSRSSAARAKPVQPAARSCRRCSAGLLPIPGCGMTCPAWRGTPGSVRATSRGCSARETGITPAAWVEAARVLDRAVRCWKAARGHPSRSQAECGIRQCRYAAPHLLQACRCNAGANTGAATRIRSGRVKQGPAKDPRPIPAPTRPDARPAGRPARPGRCPPDNRGAPPAVDVDGRIRQHAGLPLDRHALGVPKGDVRPPEPELDAAPLPAGTVRPSSGRPAAPGSWWTPRSPCISTISGRAASSSMIRGLDDRMRGPGPAGAVSRRRHGPRKS